MRIRAVHISGQGQCPGGTTTETIVVFTAAAALAGGLFVAHLIQYGRIFPDLLQIIVSDIADYNRNEAAGRHITIGLDI